VPALAAISTGLGFVFCSLSLFLQKEQILCHLGKIKFLKIKTLEKLLIGIVCHLEPIKPPANRLILRAGKSAWKRAAQPTLEQAAKLW
jgi:hypothetical protein